MTPDTKAALDDLLRVQQLTDVTPVRVQRWQAAVRELMTESDVLALGAKAAASGREGRVVDMEILIANANATKERK